MTQLGAFFVALLLFDLILLAIGVFGSPFPVLCLLGGIVLGKHLKRIFYS